VDGTPTAVPISDATVIFRSSEQEQEDDASDDEEQPSPKRQKVVDLTKDAMEIAPASNPPFFSILGSVDGIRDELAPNDANELGDDDDSWILRRVVVECKHRMNRIHNAPPLYDQVQAAAYCFMYGATEADIIQVMRQKASMMKQIAGEEKKEHESVRVGDEEHADPPVSVSADHAEMETEPSPAEDSMSLLKPDSIILSVDRVSLDDPILQHRRQWHATVLPRLRSFVDAVYSIRSQDDKRYQLLLTASDPSGATMDQAWQLLHTECPWLLDCDTAFYRSELVADSFQSS
jgi:hypothetical protein